MFKKIFGWAFIFTVFVYAFVSLYKIVTTFAPDFSVFYTTAYNATHGISVYTGTKIFTGFGYPVVTVIPFILFLIFPYQISQGLFVILSFLTIPLIVAISLKILKVKATKFIIILISSFIFLSFPTKFTLGMGQSNLVVYALLLLSFWISGKSGKLGVLGGVLFGLVLIIKPVMGFLVLYFLLYKKWRFLFFAFLTVTIGFLSSIVFFQIGIKDYFYYFQKFLPHILGQQGREIYYNQGISGFISRLTPNIFLRSVLTLCLDLLLVVSVFWAIIKRNLKQVTGFALVLSILPLVDSLSWQHHFVFLIFPFIYLTFQISPSFWLVQNQPRSWMRSFHSLTRMTKKITMNILLLISYFFVSYNIKDPSNLYKFPSSLILSHTFFGAVILFLLLIYFITKVGTVQKKERISR